MYNVQFKKRNLKSFGGFTLLELVVVVAVMAILGVIFTDILIQTLRGENKVKAINRTKQNGQMVLERLTNEIRSAKAVVCVGKLDPLNVSDDTIVLYNYTQDNDGNINKKSYRRFVFVKSDIATQRNGSIVSDSFNEGDFDSVNIPPEQICTMPIVDQTKVNVTDTDRVTGVSVSFDLVSPVFKRDIKTGYNETVTVRFRASAGVSAGYAYETTVKEGGILFVTTVGVRGIQ